MTDIASWYGPASRLPNCVWSQALFPWFPQDTTCCRPWIFFPSTHPQFRDILSAHLIDIYTPPTSVIFLAPLSIFLCSYFRLPDWWYSWTFRWVPGRLISADIPQPSLFPLRIRITFHQVTMCATSWLMLQSWPIRFLSSLSMHGLANPSHWWWSLSGVPRWSLPGSSL